MWFTYVYSVCVVLQDVLRNWHSREPQIIRTMNELVANAEKAAYAFRNGIIHVYVIIQVRTFSVAQVI